MTQAVIALVLLAALGHANCQGYYASGPSIYGGYGPVTYNTPAKFVPYQWQAAYAQPSANYPGSSSAASYSSNPATYQSTDHYAYQQQQPYYAYSTEKYYNSYPSASYSTSNSYYPMSYSVSSQQYPYTQ